MKSRSSRVWHKVLVYFALAHPEGGEPRPGGPTHSRYGDTSPRLDQDIDELRARLDALERRAR